MHVPTFQSLVCLSLLTVPYASAIPLDENLWPRAATTCNPNDVKTVKNSNKQPTAYCKSWLSAKQSKSTVKDLSVAKVSSACTCILASASSSSAATAKRTTVSTKKTTSATKKATSTTKKTTSATKEAKSTTKKTSSTKKASSSTKKSSSLSTKKASASIKTALKQISVATKASSSSSSTRRPPSTPTQKTSSTQKTTTSSKKTTTTTASTSKLSTSAPKTIKSINVTSQKPTSTSASIKQSSSSSSTKASSSPSSSKTTKSSSIHSIISSSSFSSSSSSSTSFVAPSGSAIPTDPVTSVVANQKAPTSVSTRASSSAQSSSNVAASSQTSSASTNSKDASTGSNIVTNGNFNQGSTTGWHGARAYGTKFNVASLAGDSNYEALVKYALDVNDNASGQLYQNVNIPANSAWQLGADVYLNYPNGLPAGVSCVVKYSLGSDAIILKQYGVASSSGAVLSDTASGQLSTGFTGRFQIDTYCSTTSSAASFALGFGNIQLLVSDAGSAATSTTAAPNAALATASMPSTTSSAASASATSANMLTNGDFGSGDYTGWALFRLGSPTFAIQGNPGAYVSYITFPAGGDANSQASLMQQSATATAGKTYTVSMGLLLNYPSGLPNDGSSCSLQVYFVDSNGFGMSFVQTSYKNGDAAYQSISGTGSVNNGFKGVFDILIRCYGSASAIVAGVEDVQLFES
ncbi:hypothetical protein E4T39_01972 [Aureobasidium subglaciale]|nr:hypothetical protein E4T39_01972 [Aureobasidium subglaciale]